MNQTTASGLWDVIVVGAGPAGALAATLLARQHRRVLLVDRAPFPREKACGCCLGARGARLLRELGLAEVLEGAARLRDVELRHANRRVRLQIPAGYAIARAVLDDRLVQAAIAEGAVFHAETSARLLPFGRGRRRVQLTSSGQRSVPEASLILACDGIQGTLLDGDGCEWEIARDAWMGVSVSVSGSSFPSPQGTIAMHVAHDGYVGAVRLCDGTLHFAAALNPRSARENGGPIPTMQMILEATGAGRCEQLDSARPKGTPLLTRERTRYGSHRVLAVGDACSYIEPFTGEGMTWAIESASLLASLLPTDLRRWSDEAPERWRELQRQQIGAEQWLCRALRFVLHRPTLVGAGMRLADEVPAVGRAMAASLDFHGHPAARSWS